MATSAHYGDRSGGGIVPDEAHFLDQLRAIVGRRHVLTSEGSTRRYRIGFRFGSGPASAVVRPGSLVEQWRVLKACAAANKIIIMQAANTGLTGGSTPNGSDYDRDIVIVSTLRLSKIRLIDEGRQVICHPGATLFQLEKALAARSDKAVAIRSEAHRDWRRPGREVIAATGNSHRRWARHHGAR